MKPDMPVLEIPSDLFTWGNDGPNKSIGCAEASDLPSRFLSHPLYSDACDVGFAVRSVRTGKRMLFYLAEELRQDGELTGWQFKRLSSEPIDGAPADVTILVLND